MELLDALLLLKEEAVAGDVDEPDYGICLNLYILTNSVEFSYDFVRDNCKGWEHFSGDTSFPIKGYDLDGLWEGEQLELRLSLLDHLITKARQQGA